MSEKKSQKMSDVGNYDGGFLKKLLRDMVLIRRFEEKTAQMYGLRKIGGFLHLYNGQEAVAVGAVAALDLEKDYLLTSYRDHGHALAVGMDPKSVMAELYGKITGCSRGKGGSMHMFDAERHFLGGNGIVGAQIPIATGVAFKQMYHNDGGVTLCFFGDGAIHQGAFHESLNLAKIWNLPVIYIVENNQFGMGTAVKRVSGLDDFSLKAAGYDLQGKVVDGMDVLAVYEGIKEVTLDAREKGNAWLLDIKTYRYKGHSASDPAKYRTKEELESYKQQDPIVQLKERMIAAGVLDDQDYQEMDSQIKKEVQEAVDFAEKSAEPALHTMYEDILA
ncbi:pyruvate dehydrogenase E1 component alpha subunit [Alkalispirochaeta americana]|uniref:Pyruvate dehydrogenase E1 component subunit alpha n=1 Tax=Alkalispirochaeta americana TaxID=159291 RepID=A0A1N6NYE1_9SPIO|nr:pyruvate dehydrogenase (acetyl-transferring) E1 component subunit alpha [Alkalispirochaeta americana]SIP97158.1 pyruvate dehydrogenase E1 component alpha subunit [Alkalispirochaeta americana]